MNVNISQALGRLVEESRTLDEILANAVKIVARELSVDACSIFLVEPRDQRLHLLATWGLEQASLGRVSLDVSEGLVGRVVATMQPLAVEQAAAHPAYHHLSETGEARFASFLGAPLAIRDRLIGVIVVQTVAPRAFSDGEVEALEAVSAQLVGIVANSRLIVALNRGDGADTALALQGITPLRAPPSRAPRVYKGHPASSGIAIGLAVLRGGYALDAHREGQAVLGEDIERARLRDALEKTWNEILRIQRAAAHEADEEHALVFSSHLLLLRDPVLLERFEAAVSGGVAAAVAVDAALREFARQLESVDDPYIAERVEDIHDLRSRILNHLLEGGAHASIRDCIVVATRTPPSLVVEIKAEGARGLVTEVGGMTSHGILLARTMRVPVVTGIVDLAAVVHNGDPLIVDGSAGLVVQNPDEETLAEYAEAALRVERQRTEYAKYRSEPCRTADGVRVQLKANVNIAADLAVARENGAEGVGLYRTEFPFILREDFPTREEQVRIYRRAYEVFPNGPINFRVLDLGGDKFVPGGVIKTARNPFHGYRSIRVLFDHPNVLTDQVQAFALAAGVRPLRLLIPMVTSMEELRRVRRLIAEALAALEGRDAARAPEVGVMIEVPAAVEVAADLAREADFLCIGTNDLIQYSLVVNREDSRMTSQIDSYHPAILRMIRRVVEAGHRVGRRVSVCGEMAADRSLAALLVALGVDELSVAPGVIPEVKQSLAAVNLGALAVKSAALLACVEAEEMREALRVALAASAPA